jgi:hypothetical protein
MISFDVNPRMAPSGARFYVLRQKEVTRPCWAWMYECRKAQRPQGMAEGRATREQLPRCVRVAGSGPAIGLSIVRVNGQQYSPRDHFFACLRSVAISVWPLFSARAISDASTTARLLSRSFTTSTWPFSAAAPRGAGTGFPGIVT